MQTTERFARYTTEHPLEFWIRNDKNGKPRARYWSGRSFPLPLKDAQALEAAGRAVEIPMPWFEMI